jgi:hypothetical protein
MEVKVEVRQLVVVSAGQRKQSEIMSNIKASTSVASSYY